MHPIIKKDLEYITNVNLPWDLLENQTVLISGANGFIPAYIVRSLLYLNDKDDLSINVIGLVRNKEKAENRFSEYIDRQDFKLIVQDVCEPLTISDKVDYIIHAASQASPKYYGKDPVGTLKANTVGTYNLLEFSRKNNVKEFLFISSGEVYGTPDEEHMPVREDFWGYVNPLDVRSCYSESKRMGENMCVCWSHQYSIIAKIARPFHTYGPGISLDDRRVYADFIADVVNNRDIRMNSDGSALRPFCYLADVAAGIFTVLLKGKSGEAYNVATDKETSILELANILISLFPEKRLKIIRDKGSEQEGYIKSKISRNYPDLTKLKSLGWSPKYSVEDGFKRTILSYYDE